MSRVRDLASILTASSSMATDAEVSAVSAQIPAYVSGKNSIINGGFDFWQRGTSFASTGGAYTADRWFAAASGSGSSTFSRQLSGSTLPQFQYCIRSQRNSGSSETTAQQIGYTIETADSLKFAGQTITISYYARAGANYSPANSILYFILNSGTGTDQRILGGGFTGVSTLIFQGPAISTTWQRFSYSIAVPSTSTQLGFYWQANVFGTAGTNDYFEVTGVQLEISSTATPFSRAGGSLQGELAACQRYYYRPSADSGYKLFGIGYASNTSTLVTLVPFPVTMRTTPSSIDTSSMASFYWEGIAGGSSPTSVTIGGSASSYNGQVVVSKASGFTAGNVYCLFSNGVAGYIGFSAEL